MARETEEPMKDEFGDDTHPAFGMLGAHRGQNTPGASLFDSDIRHQNTVTVRLHTATRKRDLNRDWVHSDQQLFEVEMSEAQWASFVSSMNVGDGVPVTIRMTPDDYMVPGVPYAPRLAESMREVHETGARLAAAIAEAFDAYKANKSAANLRILEATIRNVTPNVDYAAKSLSEHAENVVQRARADIEAMVLQKSRQLGIEPSDLGDTLAIEAGER